jgi:hypothetical protein
MGARTKESSNLALGTVARKTVLSPAHRRAPKKSASATLSVTYGGVTKTVAMKTTRR